MQFLRFIWISPQLKTIDSSAYSRHYTIKMYISEILDAAVNFAAHMVGMYQLETGSWW